jgi:hypothetical protein
MGFFSRLFGTGTRASSRLMPSTEAEKIINDFGAALAARTELYSDAAKLPHPKIKVKEALIIWIDATHDATARDVLKGAYLSLAEWQEGIGQGLHDLDLTDRPGEELARRRIVESGPAYLALSERVTTEMRQLIAELKSARL